MYIQNGQNAERSVPSAEDVRVGPVSCASFIDVCVIGDEKRPGRFWSRFSLDTGGKARFGSGNR